MYCSNCNNIVSDDSKFCNSCGNQFSTITNNGTYAKEQQSQNRVVAGTETNIRRVGFSINAILAGLGAIMMLISLALPYYVIRFLFVSVNLNGADLVSTSEEGDISSLAIWAVIICASIVLITVIFSINYADDSKGTWVFLGILAGASVIFSAYRELNNFNTYAYQNDVAEVLDVSIGSGIIVAVIGAVLILIGGLISLPKKY